MGPFTNLPILHAIIVICITLTYGINTIIHCSYLVRRTSFSIACSASMLIMLPCFHLLKNVFMFIPEGHFPTYRIWLPVALFWSSLFLMRNLVTQIFLPFHAIFNFSVPASNIFSFSLFFISLTVTSFNYIFCVFILLGNC